MATGEGAQVNSALPIPHLPNEGFPDTPEQPAILISKLWKRYGTVQAVRGIDLEVQRREIFGLIGPDGAGKTWQEQMVYAIDVVLVLENSRKVSNDLLVAFFLHH